MRMFVLSAALVAALAGGCDGQFQRGGLDASSGWRAGPYYGPMMGYGYCPGAANGDGGGEQGWYGSGMMAGHGGMMGDASGPMMGRAGAFDAQQAQAWLESVKSQIGITPTQETVWQAYADAVEADRASMLSMHQRMPALMHGTGVDAPGRLQSHLELMQTRLASLQHVQQASQALFQELDAEQRRRADQMLWSGCWR